MASTPPPGSGRGLEPDRQPAMPRGQRKTLVPIIVLVLAIVVAGMIYASTRTSPNFDESTVDQPAPMPTPEPTSS